MKRKNLNWMPILHYFFRFLILILLLFSLYFCFSFLGSSDLFLLKLEWSLLLHGLRAILFWFFGLKVPIFVLVSIVGSVVGSSLHMQDPAGGQPAADQPANAPTRAPGAVDQPLQAPGTEPSTSSSWDGSWIQKWFSRGDSSSAPNEGAQEAVTSSQANLPPQLPQPPGHQPPIQPGEHLSLEKVHFENYIKIADVIQEIHHDLHKRVPGGFQAERLAEMLVDRHGAEKLDEIRQSLETERRHSPYFADVQTDFKILRDSRVTEMQLRKEWQGRA